ncbi:MAG: TonB-dependent receptor [Flavobacteriaceae bacterium]
MKLVIRYLFLIGMLPSLAAQNSAVLDTVATVSLEEVKVSGLRVNENTPMAFTNLTQEEIASRNLGQDIPILLNYLPAVVTTSDAGNGIGYTGIRVRGGDARSVNVTINGIPYNDAESQGTFWVDLPDFASSVSSFQLQRGVGTSTNGNAAFGASLNLLTQAVAKEAKAQWSQSAGSFNTLKNTLQFSTGQFANGFEISGRLGKIVSDGYVDRASSNLKSFFLQAAYQDENTLIKLLGFGGHEITYQSWYGVDEATLKNNRTYNPAGEIYSSNGQLTGYYDNQVDNYQQDHYQFHWTQQLNKRWDFSLGLNYTYGRGYYEEYYDRWVDENVSFGGDTTFDYLQLAAIRIRDVDVTATENVQRKWLDNDYYVANLGVNYQNGSSTINLGALYSQYIGDHYGELIWAQQAGDVLPRHRFYENTGTKIETSVFAKWTQEFSSKWIGYLDLQVRNVKYEVVGQVAGPSPFAVDDHFSFFNPKAGITYKASQAQRFFISFALAHREPNRTDYENGNPVPEKLNDFEMGWRLQQSNLQLQINAYWMAYQDQLALTGALDAVGNPIRENIGNSRRIGIEAEAKIPLAKQWLWQPNIALSRNENKDYFFQRDGQLTRLGNTPLAFSPVVIAGNALVFVPSTNFQVALLSKFIGAQYMGNIDSAISKLPSYFVSDLNASYRWNPKRWFEEVQLNLLINNIFNEQYVSNGYFYTYDDDWSNPGQTTTIEGAGFYPQAGTHFLVGMSLRF